MRKRKFSLVLGAVCVVVMGITASSAFAAVDAKPQAAAAAGGTVIFGADQEPRTLNTLTVEGNALWGSLVLQPVITFASKYNNKGMLIHRPDREPDSQQRDAAGRHVQAQAGGEVE